MRNYLAQFIGLCLGIPFVCHPFDVEARVFKNARIDKLVRGTQVFIDKEGARKPASKGHVAKSGQAVKTASDTEVRLLFDGETIAHLIRDSRIKLGTRCFEVDEGTILVSSGRHRSCVGNTYIGRRSTIVLTRYGPDRYTLSVLNGAAYLESDPPAEDDAPAQDLAAKEVIQLYPSFRPIFGIGAGGFTSNSGGVDFGDSTALVLGEVNMFLPLAQRNTSQILYSYTSASANFDEFWGVSTEIGYRWFNPGRRSSQGIFVGYDGVESTECFSSQVALGAEYEVNRWVFGVNGGIRADNCEDGVSYASAQVGIPVARISEDTAHLFAGPYIVEWQGDEYVGGRVSVAVPITPNLTLYGYGQYDDLFDTVLGGNISYRFPAGGRFLHDPNRSATDTPPHSDEAATFAGEGVLISAGEEVTLDGQGQLLDRSRMSRPRFEQLVVDTMAGFPLLPESLSIYDTYKDLYGESTEQVMAITGARWVNNARTPYPRLRGVQTPFVPANLLRQEEREETELSDTPVSAAPQEGAVEGTEDFGVTRNLSLPGVPSVLRTGRQSIRVTP